MKPLPPLFIPLRSKYFLEFARGTKSIEWRRHGPRFNERTVHVGRRVVLAKGYAHPRLTGVVVAIEFRPAEQVEGAAAIYPPGCELIGLHIKLSRRQAKARLPARPPALPHASLPGRNS